MSNNWTENDIPDLSGKTVIITGTGGLGYEAALMMATAGAKVILAGRNAEKGQQSIDLIAQTNPRGSVHFEMLDLADLTSIEQFADRMIAQEPQIDILINNAGVLSPPKRLTTADGFELQFGTNFLGHFALTARLLPLLKKASARVVTLASIAHRMGRINFDDLQGEKKYNAWDSYGQSKLAMLMFARELQRRSGIEDWGITAIAAHPGYARTKIFSNGPGEKSLMATMNQRFGGWMSQSAKDGAMPIMLAATAPDAGKGGYYGPTGFMEMKGPAGKAFVSKAARDEQTAKRLWDVAETLVGITF